eukprot:SAG31_NODE_1162_length_9594_cov_3.045498_9_plen_157_part_00
MSLSTLVRCHKSIRTDQLCYEPMLAALVFEFQRNVTLLDAGEFDSAKFNVSDEWLNLNQAKLRSGSGTGGKAGGSKGNGNTMATKLRSRPLDRLQFGVGGNAWHLDDGELDIAAYEMLFLTVGTSSSLLSPKQRETLDVVRAKLGKRLGQFLENYL